MNATLNSYAATMPVPRPMRPVLNCGYRAWQHVTKRGRFGQEGTE